MRPSVYSRAVGWVGGILDSPPKTVSDLVTTTLHHAVCFYQKYSQAQSQSN